MRLNKGQKVLHMACWKSAIEGDLEPVYWQGIKVGHIEKYDSRIRVELLRAHMLDKFKRGDKAVNVSMIWRAGTVRAVGGVEQQS